MMNNGITTMTLPAKPQPQRNIGLMFAPLIMEIVGKKLSSKKMVTLNTLHTYSDSKKYVDTYISNLRDFGIDFDEYYEDTIHKEELIDILEKLINNGKIIKKEKNIYKCDCGKVEFLENGKCFNDGKLYSKIGDNYICNYCGSIAKRIKKEVLVMKYDSINEKVNVFPSFLAKEMSYFSDLFNGEDILISKIRDTNLNVVINNTEYNIDVEYVWSQLHGISNNNKVMIASNHQVYVMFMINYLNRLNNGADLFFVLTPYMDNSTKFVDFDKKISRLSATKIKLFLFYSLKWGKKTCLWDYGLYKKINRLDDITADRLYNDICCPLKSADFNQMIIDLAEEFLKRNFDKDLEKIKK